MIYSGLRVATILQHTCIRVTFSVTFIFRTRPSRKASGSGQAAIDILIVYWMTPDSYSVYWAWWPSIIADYYSATNNDNGTLVLLAPWPLSFKASHRRWSSWTIGRPESLAEMSYRSCEKSYLWNVLRTYHVHMNLCNYVTHFSTMCTINTRKVLHGREPGLTWFTSSTGDSVCYSTVILCEIWKWCCKRRNAVYYYFYHSTRILTDVLSNYMDAANRESCLTGLLDSPGAVNNQELSYETC